MNLRLITLPILLLVFNQILFAQNVNNDVMHPKMSYDTFWDNMKQLCGLAFEGRVEHAPTGDTVFSDQVIQIHVGRCDDNKIFVHLHVGDDRSRTWVLTREDGRLLLKHDHRHKDGTEDILSQYGGWTSNTGMSTTQVFPADQFTVSILPAASANVWWFELISGQYLTYNLRRLNTDRFFSLRFDLSKTVDTPPNAWGWDE
jgi:hypothetical protein